MADAQASGACGSNIVWVQVPSPASFFYLKKDKNISQVAECTWDFVILLFLQLTLQANVVPLRYLMYRYGYYILIP